MYSPYGMIVPVWKSWPLRSTGLCLASAVPVVKRRWIATCSNRVNAGRGVTYDTAQEKSRASPVTFRPIVRRAISADLAARTAGCSSEVERTPPVV
jgi:hypothetical protein